MPALRRLLGFKPQVDACLRAKTPVERIARQRLIEAAIGDVADAPPAGQAEEKEGLCIALFLYEPLCKAVDPAVEPGAAPAEPGHDQPVCKRKRFCRGRQALQEEVPEFRLVSEASGQFVEGGPV